MNKKEILNDEILDSVTGGGKKTGGVTYKLPDNCPNCGAALVKIRNAKSAICMECGTEVEAVATGSWNPGF